MSEEATFFESLLSSFKDVAHKMHVITDAGVDVVVSIAAMPGQGLDILDMYAGYNAKVLFNHDTNFLDRDFSKSMESYLDEKIHEVMPLAELKSDWDKGLNSFVKVGSFAVPPLTLSMLTKWTTQAAENYVKTGYPVGNIKGHNGTLEEVYDFVHKLRSTHSSPLTPISP
ncbi:MAG: hypothetical protein HRT94_01115 [Alphaproteobacteria bacterium]|nr:hypothetical protein [Alphaproteobacteria bacterium]